MIESPWHVLHVSTNHEKRVAQHLDVRAVEHYLPLYTMRSKWSDRTVTLERPLFAGYVFVRYAAQSRLAVVSTPGVLRLLGDGTSDTVSAVEIERIREGLKSGCILRPHPCVAVGEVVRVQRGVFEGVEGIVTELRHPCKVVLALAATRQCFSLEVELDDIEVVRKPVSRAVMTRSPGFALSRA